MGIEIKKYITIKGEDGPEFRVSISNESVNVRQLNDDLSQSAVEIPKQVWDAIVKLVGGDNDVVNIPAGSLPITLTKPFEPWTKAPKTGRGDDVTWTIPEEIPPCYRS